MILDLTNIKGDLILIELHQAGPRFNFEGRPDQRGYIAMEWFPDDFEAIKMATDKVQILYIFTVFSNVVFSQVGHFYLKFTDLKVNLKMTKHQICTT